MTSLQNITGTVDRLLHLVIGFKGRYVFSQVDISDIISPAFMTTRQICCDEWEFSCFWCLL